MHRLKAFKVPLWKRLFDIALTTIAIILLSPFIIIIIIAIRLESKGPIIYRSKRVGCNYNVFDFFKFRSMYTGADSRLKDLQSKNQYVAEVTELETTPIDFSSLGDFMIDDNSLISDDFIVEEIDFLKKRGDEQDNNFVKIPNDPRITKVGAFMRKYSIDELPQLLNILKGDMSIVGNRPLPLYEAEMLTQDDYAERFMAPAGLTGLWQVEKRGDAGKLSAEERKQLDIRYAREFSFWLDIKIIIKTFTAFIQKENV